MMRVLRSGRVVEVDERGKASFIACHWGIEVPNGHPEPDSRADMYDIVDCGGRMYDDPPDGMRCEHGHEFGNLERRWAPYGPEWQREQMERRMELDGIGVS